jgi:hypothetical protein
VRQRRSPNATLSRARTAGDRGADFRCLGRRTPGSHITGRRANRPSGRGLGTTPHRCTTGAGVRRNLFPGRHPAWNLDNLYSISNRPSDPNADSFADSDSDRYTNRDADRDAYTNADPNRNANPNPYANSNRNANPDARANRCSSWERGHGDASKRIDRTR